MLNLCEIVVHSVWVFLTQWMWCCTRNTFRSLANREPDTACFYFTVQMYLLSSSLRILSLSLFLLFASFIFPAGNWFEVNGNCFIFSHRDSWVFKLKQTVPCCATESWLPNFFVWNRWLQNCLKRPSQNSVMLWI